MIKKIKKVHHKSFNNYDSSELDFSRINILYGKNGQGKSSLVNFIKDSVEKGVFNDFEIDSSDFCVFLYDEEYKNKLFYSSDRFKTFYVADGVEKLILKKHKLLDKKSKLEGFEAKLNSNIGNINKSKDELKSTIAKKTREVLSRIDEKYNNPQSYKSTHVKIEWPNESNLLSHEELEKIKTMKKNANYEIIKEFYFDNFKKIEAGIKTLNDMVKQTPENNAIERFKKDDSLENLAKLAFEIRKRLVEYEEKCPLCEQSVVGIKLWERLEKHFNEEYKQFIDRLDKAKEFFEKSKQELNSYTKWINENFIKTKLLLDIDIDQKRQEYLGSINAAIGQIDKIIDCIDTKKQNPNKDDIAFSIDLSCFQGILNSDVSSLIKTHNDKQQTYKEDISRNIEKIKKHFVAEEKEKFQQYDSLISLYNNLKEKKKCALNKREEQIKNIEEEFKKMDKSFQKLNDDIAGWFFKDIHFEKIGDTHYKIQRLGFDEQWFDCDRGLSEGEKTIISIIYFTNHFLSKIKDIKECPLVFLDDPINSLDNTNRDKIINYISQKLLPSQELQEQEQRQFFIATHIDEVCDKFNKKLDKTKSIFEIKKFKNQSEIQKLESFKLNNDFKTIYERLCGYVSENGKYEDAFTIKDDVRFMLEKINNIFFDDTKNFTNCYKNLLKKLNIEEKYTANDMQDLNHGKNPINSDEIVEKVKFVVEIVQKIRDM